MEHVGKAVELVRGAKRRHEPRGAVVAAEQLEAGGEGVCKGLPPALGPGENETKVLYLPVRTRPKVRI